MDVVSSQENRAGIQLYLDQDYPAAEAALADAVKLSPSWAEGWSYLGYSQYMQKRFTEAATSLERAVMLDQESAEARFGLGLVWAAIKRVDAAIACWDETLRLRPAHADARKSLVGALVYRAQQRLNEKDYDKAEIDLERAIKIDHTAAQPVVILANHFVDHGMTPRAQKTVKEALAYLPNDGQIQALGAKLNVQATSDVILAAQDVQAKQQIQKAQEVPCPFCKRPVMEWASVCPHCLQQIKASPSLFAQRQAETKGYQWQDVMYYIVTVLWILFGVIPLVVAAIAIFAVGQQFDSLGRGAPDFSGLAMIPLIFAGARLLLGVGLLFQNDWCMSIARWICILFILKNVLWLMVYFYARAYFDLTMDILSIALDGFLLYLLNYIGVD